MRTKKSIKAEVIEHFSQPKAKYGYGKHGCVYRGGKNRVSKTRCPIGLLMPDAFYRPGFEQSTVLMLFNNEGIDTMREALNLGSTVNAEWLQGLQDLHDDYAYEQRPIEDFLTEVRKF